MCAFISVHKKACNCLFLLFAYLLLLAAKINKKISSMSFLINIFYFGLKKKRRDNKLIGLVTWFLEVTIS